MATMNISLPDQMKDWVERQAEGGRYSNSSDYVRDLIRRDQVRAEQIAAMQAKIDEGLASGVSSHTLPEIFELARAEFARQEMAGKA
ncbi:type II toxin-antitoxin system ParD family antitoxin [Asticcacaulis solisilvae]|uniref:type II toxin-antitoxin system ParD family antitoxin n=1 Tax=Asticcacaulis solisilvae TaxID=1217274 RepID=UPI003FD74962